MREVGPSHHPKRAWPQQLKGKQENDWRKILVMPWESGFFKKENQFTGCVWRQEPEKDSHTVREDFHLGIEHKTEREQSKWGHLFSIRVLGQFWFIPARDYPGHQDYMRTDLRDLYPPQVSGESQKVWPADVQAQHVRGDSCGITPANAIARHEHLCFGSRSTFMVTKST